MESPDTKSIGCQVERITNKHTSNKNDRKKGAEISLGGSYYATVTKYKGITYLNIRLKQKLYNCYV